MQVTLENEVLKAGVNLFGAELATLVKKESNVEYIWNADEKYWKRSAPVLFPFVGLLKNKQYIYDGKTYPMTAHGFARDMEFSLVSNDGKEAWFSLSSDETTYEKYPFAFTLEIGYRLEGSKLEVIWKVINEDDKTMHFSIGGHPAFLCPLNGEGKLTDGIIEFDTDKELRCSQINVETGLVFAKERYIQTDNGKLQITEHLFDEDALVLENNQAHKVSLCNPDGKPYVTVSFDAPLFGVWSPTGKNAPFVCIEPWYGRCDAEDFNGILEEREYDNQLEPGESFEASHVIEIL